MYITICIYRELFIHIYNVRDLSNKIFSFFNHFLFCLYQEPYIDKLMYKRERFFLEKNYNFAVD